jgi:DNA-binding winged helix-turn-helix (wHTH) protein/tetratricopeptide (TPR) repeat protein
MMAPDYLFGPFRLDPGNARLWHGLEEIILRPKSFAVLQYLAARPGRLVMREELLQVIWPGIAVSDAVLTVCIGEIRQALRDNPHAPRYIETVHRRGYRFLGTITAAPGPGDPPGLERSPETAPSQQITPSSSSLSAQPSILSAVSVVGREAQVSQLEGWLNQARSGLRQVVFVTGEAGIGKTTLVNAFLAQITSGAPLWVARGQCMAHYGAGEAYLPVLDALGRLCRGPGSAPLLAGLVQHAPTWMVQLPAPLSVNELEALQRRVTGASRERMLRELAEALEVLTVERPLVLVLEDLHWSDYATLDLISWLAQRQEPARLLVLGTYRPVDVIVRGHPLQGVKQELLRHRQCAELSLELLTPAEVMQYLAARFTVDTPLSASFRVLAQAIHQRTDGHALFMVTVVDALIQRRALVERDGQWQVQGGIERAVLEVPESLQQMVEQQLSQLSAYDQQVLEAASVTGMQFSAAAVAAGLEERVDAVDGRCSTLARRGQFLQSHGVEEWPDGTVVSCYRFRHTLYQQVVYDRLPVGRRIQLHARIGMRKESGYQGLAVERAVELAAHFEQGRGYGKAVQYLKLAAEKALHRYAYQEAIGHLSRGLAVLPRLPETPERAQLELDLQITLGQTLTVTQGPGAAAVARVYARAEELCEQVDDISQRIAVLRGLRRAMQGRGEPQRAHPLAEEFLRMAQQAQDAALLIEGLVALGVCLFYLGRVATAHAHLQEGLALYDAQRSRAHSFPAGQDLRVLGLTYDAMALWVLGYPEQALEQSRRAINLAEEVAHPWDLAMALGYAAVVCVLRGDRQTALERAEATIQLATAQGVFPWIGRGMMLRGWALAEQGREREGLAQIQQGLALWQANGQELGRPFWLALLGERYAKVGQVEEGLQVIAEALAMTQTRELRVWEAEVQRLRGEMLFQQLAGMDTGSAPAAWPRSPTTDGRAIGEGPRLSEAESCLRQALDIARRQRAKSLELRAAMSLSRLWQRRGQKEAARRQLEESYSWFTEGFDTADLQEGKSRLAALA